MITTLYKAMANIGNVCLLYLLSIFVFTLTGMTMFGDQTEGQDGFINKDVNFNTFYVAGMVLIRCSTGESWNGIMHDTCFYSDENGKCFLIRLYWITFMLTSFFVFINVLVAVIFE